MSFNPNDMKDRLKVAIAFMQVDTVAATAESEPREIDDAPAPANGDSLPGGFRIGNLVFNDNDPATPESLLQVRGQWKHALIVRYVHPAKTHQDRSEQRHHPNRLVRPDTLGFSVEMVDDMTLMLRKANKAFKIALVGAIDVVL